MRSVVFLARAFVDVLGLERSTPAAALLQNAFVDSRGTRVPVSSAFFHRTHMHKYVS